MMMLMMMMHVCGCPTAAAGLPSALSTMAEDAVTAAADSPFLESSLPCASAVLVLMAIPAGSSLWGRTRGAVAGNLVTGLSDEGSVALADPAKYALRSAIQVRTHTYTHT